MLHRDHAGNTVMVRKPELATGTAVRKPLGSAVREAIADGSHQARILFELGNAAQVFFSDRVLLNEARQNNACLPLLYEKYFGRAPGADRTGIVPLHGGSNFAGAFRVLRAMEMDARIVADLDYAFRHAKDLAEDKDHPDLPAVKGILGRLQQAHGFPVEGGLPKNDRKHGWTAADAWALFAKDADGAKIASAEHKKLRTLWHLGLEEGTIEDALGVSDKGEEAIQTVEQGLAEMKMADVKTSYPSWQNSGLADKLRRPMPTLQPRALDPKSAALRVNVPCTEKRLAKRLVNALPEGSRAQRFVWEATDSGRKIGWHPKTDFSRVRRLLELWSRNDTANSLRG